MLETIFRRFDETPVSVNFMLTDLAELVLGKSLQTDDGALLKQVKQLIKLRNRVAHDGAEPTPEEARAGVRAAEATFDWLQQRRQS